MNRPSNRSKRPNPVVPVAKARSQAPDIYTPLRHYGRLVRVLQVWRLHEAENRWLYLKRIRSEDYDPSESIAEIVKARFGGGSYRAKVLGDRDRELRRERYLRQLSFDIEGPPTAETLHLMSLTEEGR
jgi:hypothetical protein